MHSLHDCIQYRHELELHLTQCMSSRPTCSYQTFTFWLSGGRVPQNLRESVSLGRRPRRRATSMLLCTASTWLQISLFFFATGSSIVTRHKFCCIQTAFHSCGACICSLQRRGLETSRRWDARSSPREAPRYRIQWRRSGLKSGGIRPPVIYAHDRIRRFSQIDRSNKIQPRTSFEAQKTIAKNATRGTERRVQLTTACRGGGTCMENSEKGSKFRASETRQSLAISQQASVQ
jgi:hypothetical protein